MTFETWLQSRHPEIPLQSAAAVLGLAAEGATIPFIARYRKEQTGNLDEVKIATTIDAKERFEQLVQRQQYILGEIEKQGKLTDELKGQISATFDSNLLEDLYLPYKQKRKTKAQAAREAGLEPLAEWIWNVGHGTEKPADGQTLLLWAFTFRNPDKKIEDAQNAIDGASDILIERLSENQALRQTVRTAFFDHAHVKTSKGAKPKPGSKFENYFDHSESIAALLKPENSHRYLAMRRGWVEEELTLGVGGSAQDEAFDSGLLQAFEGEACPDSATPADVLQVLKKASRLALKAHVIPSIENEVHKALREVADETSIRVFADNVRKLLMAAPFGSKSVLGIDPGIRTGCKLALVDDNGAYQASAVLYLQSADQKKNAATLLGEILKNDKIRAIAVGNGTAGRETEQFLRSTVKELGLSTPVVMVSEAGASVYSASEVAREEFPDLDLTVRGAISIARRLQDPLAELVKVEPKSIGVGQYQHDVSQPALKRSLELVVDSCVNQVGVNLNTASSWLLARVSGIGPGLAKAIVEFRGQKGLFHSRQQLLEVPRFSQKAFEQAAGFLRIPDSENPLDNTAVHPERYGLLEGVAKKMNRSVRELMGSGVELIRKEKQLREEVGPFTFDDMVSELAKPGRDPRDQFVPFQFRDDISEVADLKKDMVCPGIVTNVTNFGAFVDIGVHQDGLVHISQLSTKYVKDPKDAVSPGDRVTVKVLEVNLEKKQISLSIRAAQEGKSAPSGRPERDSQASGPRPGGRERGSRHEGHSGGAPAFGKGAGPSRGSRHDSHSGSRHEGNSGSRHDSNSGSRHDSNSGPRPGSGASTGSRPQPSKSGGSPAQPKQLFNNAFAGLAALRKDLPKS